MDYYGKKIFPSLLALEEGEKLKKEIPVECIVTLTQRQLCDLEMIMCGALNPLQGFMNQVDYLSVLDNMSLSNGLLWSIPIVLDVSKEQLSKFNGETQIGLCDNEGFMLAVMNIESTWKADKAMEAITIPMEKATYTLNSIILSHAISNDKPVINALTDYLHPCQILADLQTIYERLGRIEGIKVAFVGDGNNVANTWLIAGGVVGFNVSVATPEGYEPSGKAVYEALKHADKTGAQIQITNNPVEAVKDADVVYTDVWVSMGQEGEKEKKKDFEGFTVDEKLIKHASKNVLVMHCLPAHKGEEISEEVFEEYADLIFEQAENRLHAQKSLMNFLFK